MRLVIDLEQETFEGIEDNLETVSYIVEEVLRMVRHGYTSGYEPSWEIKDESDPDMMFWLKMMRDQIRNGQHMSDEDMRRCSEAVEEIEAIRDRMIKERKAK